MTSRTRNLYSTTGISEKLLNFLLQQIFYNFVSSLVLSHITDDRSLNVLHDNFCLVDCQEIDNNFQTTTAPFFFCNLTIGEKHVIRRSLTRCSLEDSTTSELWISVNRETRKFVTRQEDPPNISTQH